MAVSVLSNVASVVPFLDGSILRWLLVTVVALAHLLPHRLLAALNISTASLRSLAGGVSISYAFVHLVPDLAERSATLDGVDIPIGTLASADAFAIAFVGLAGFYGLERLASTAGSSATSGDESAGIALFWAHVAGFAAYNAFVGYAIVRGEMGTTNVELFAVAMALHLYGNDEALADRHPRRYHRYGQWALGAAVAAGGLAGSIYPLTPVSYTIGLGLLTGGIIFNAIKDELPRTRQSRFWAFAIGGAGYGVILLAL